MIEVATGGASHEQLPMVLRVPHNALGTNPAFAILGLGGCCRGFGGCWPQECQQPEVSLWQLGQVGAGRLWVLLYKLQAPSSLLAHAPLCSSLTHCPSTRPSRPPDRPTAGDVVLPGLLAVFCRRFDLSQRLSLKQSYFLPCIVGYGAGMLTTYAALWFSWFGDQGQPALLYLVPATLGTISLLAASRGQLRLLWDNDFEPLGLPRDQEEQAAAAWEAAEAGAGVLQAQLLPDGGFAHSSPSRERLLPSPFDRSRSSSREGTD